MRILVCSESSIKKKAVQKVFPNDAIETLDCSSLKLPAQPINSTRQCASQRLEYALATAPGYDCYVAIENGLLIKSDHGREECYVIIDQQSLRGYGEKHIFIRSQQIPFLQRIAVESDHELGHSVTLGELLHETNAMINPKNWMKTTHEYDRSEMIEQALWSAIKDRNTGLDQVQQVNSCYKTYENFPKPGVNFQDLFGALSNYEALDNLGDLFERRYSDAEIDYVVGMESRGFFGILLALRLRCGFIPIRKAGKLPGEVETVEYGTEYSRDTCQMSKDIPANSRVILFDDLIATGGSLKAGITLLEKLNCQIVDVCVLKEVVSLENKAKETVGRSYTVLLKD